MSMDKLYSLRDRLCRELDEISEKAERGQLTKEDVHDIKMLTASIHSIDEICEAEMDMGYSGARGRGSRASRDSMGRYSSDGGNYSGRMYPPYMGYSFDGGSTGNMGGEHVEARLGEIERMLKNMQTGTR